MWKGRKGAGCDVWVTPGSKLAVHRFGSECPSMPGPAGASLTVVQQALNPTSKYKKCKHLYGEACWLLLPCSHALQVLIWRGSGRTPDTAHPSQHWERLEQQLSHSSIHH